MDRKKLLIIPVLFAVISQLQCASLVMKAFKKPQLTYEGMEIKEFDFSGISFVLYLGINNENGYGLKVAGMRHQIKLEGLDLMVIESKEKFHIKPNEKTVIKIPVELSFEAITKNISGIFSKEYLRYEVTSVLNLVTSTGKIPLETIFHDKIEMIPVPLVVLTKVDLNSLDFAEVSMTFHIKILNNKQVKLTHPKLEYELFLNEMEIAKGKMESEKTEDQLELEIPVNIKLLSLKRSMIEMIRDGRIKYSINIIIKGRSKFGNYSLPLKKSGEAELY